MVRAAIGKGKAPPVVSFAREESDLFEERLPAFKHMATWNEWADSAGRLFKR